ncbi:DUF4169 family protein [Pelagibacterium lentulum]|uniref:DUF4169 domain-containing protein n=1 Tax=Pelagibacterium lentulum TaxID=2029865 RepID=A0A916RG66_9HYPH|nr:DUF4169 family protein [Pelagibacterium lentulum]GGA52563.1 hypothetical protein GCM10011499_23320 [Pelagibacterium lentulum]
MAEIVNLRAARKRKAKAEKEKQADENRLLFGRTKTEKQKIEAEKALQMRRLDGHLRNESEET